MTNRNPDLIARENWHPSKLEIPQENFFKTITWLKKHDLVAQGAGSLVENPLASQTKKR